MILAALALAVASPASNPVVTTDDGPVRGEALAGGGAVFRGIPYASPPVGPRRWRAPVRPARWSRPRDTVAEDKACPQPAYGDWNRAAAGNASEDCLFIDVRTPSLTPAARLPVMVWIHGGGNRAGANGGTVMSRITDKGIVLVSIQYRLGALGFLSHAALSAEQGGASGNYGLLDQQAALAWVQRNIARFGGDPARVTIAGESAGAQDVGLHLLAPGSRGLFARAIEESGTAGFGLPPRSLAESERLGAMIAAKAGIASDATPAQLRALPLAAIIAAQEAVDVPGLEDDSFIWLQAVIDGRVLTASPETLLASGRTNPAPLLIGVNARELTLYGGLPNARAIIAREFPTRVAETTRLYGLQPGGTPADDPRLGDVTLQLANDVTFRCPTVAVSKALAAHGHPVWQYQFDYARPGGTVSHGSEIGYIMGSPRPGEPPLQDYWVNFVKTGDPNGSGLPRWPRYDTKTRAYLSFAQSGPATAANLRGEICATRNTP